MATLGESKSGVDAIGAPEGAPLVAPTTEVIADLTGGDSGPSAPAEVAPEAPPAPAKAVAKKAAAPVKKAAAPVAPHAAPAPEPAPVPVPEVVEVVVPEGSVTFFCDQWAGVRVYGTGIKFEDHRFTTADEGEIARLDAWEHARREG